MFVQAPKPNGGMLFESTCADFLGSVGEDVVVRLKWGGQTEYIGKLVSIDSYMNIQLAGAEEWIDGEMTSTLGQVLIRYAISQWDLS
jgi:small nuclear ribonucleoprotein (snRNP)-like protein